MKKLNLFIGIVIGILFFSCSSEDDNNNHSDNDPIVGQWKIINETYFDLNGNQSFQQTPSDCLQESRETFSLNGAYNWTSFIEESNGDCVNIIQTVNNGQWELLANGNYKISGTVIYTDADSFNLNLEFDDTNFSNNSMNLALKATIQEFDESGNIEDEYIRLFEYEKIN